MNQVENVGVEKIKTAPENTPNTIANALVMQNATYLANQ